MLTQAKEFTNDLNQRWRELGKEPAAFSHLAADCLSEHKLWKFTSITEFTSALMKPTDICRQFDVRAPVGTAPLTLAVSPDEDFYVTAAIWFTEDMSIHDHNFVGAFAVADGDCAHSVYRYQVEEPLDDMDIGVLEAAVTEPLLPGTVREIAAGRQFIHKNMHLAQPTLTIVASAPVLGVPRRQYLSSGISLHTAQTDVTARRLQVLRALLTLRSQEARAFLLDALARPTSASEWFRLAHTWLRVRGDQQELADLVGRTAAPYDSNVTSALLDAVFSDLRASSANRSRPQKGS